MTIGRHTDGRSERRKGWSEKRRRKENERKPAREKDERKRPGTHPEGQHRAVEIMRGSVEQWRLCTAGV